MTRLAPLAALGVVLAGGVALQMRHQAEPPPAQVIAPAGPGALPPPPRLVPVALAGLSDMVERPLFSPDRRAPPPAKIASTVAPPATVNLTLIGTIVTSHGQLAVVMLDKASKTEYVRVGDVVGGWRVETIERREIRIINGPHSVAVALRDAPGERRHDPKREGNAQK